jgi:hypothetical protein
MLRVGCQAPPWVGGKEEKEELRRVNPGGEGGVKMVKQGLRVRSGIWMEEAQLAAATRATQTAEDT